MRDDGRITLRAGSPPDRDETDGKLPAAVVRFHTDATLCRTTCCRSWPWSRWTPRPGAAPVTPRTRRRRCSAPWVGQPAALRARPISGVRQSARVSLAPPPRPTRRYGWTSTTRADLKRIVLRIDPDRACGCNCLRWPVSRRAWCTWTPHSPASSASRPSRTSGCCSPHLSGDRQLFAGSDSVEETWRVVQPLLDDPSPVRPY